MKQNYSHCIILRFTDAKLFPKTRESKDRAIGADKNGKPQMINRSIDKKGKNPSAPHVEVRLGTLHANHVSNVLHVLMGERPVPRFRGVMKEYLTPDTAIDELAKGAGITVDTPIITNRFDATKESYPTEMQTVRKSLSNSFRASSLSYQIGTYKTVKCVSGDISWDRICFYLGNELFDSFLTIMKTFAGEDCLKMSLADVLKKVTYTKQLDEFVELCREERKMPMVHLFHPKSENAVEIGKYMGRSEIRDRYVCLNMSGVEEVSRLSGKIIVPVSDKSFIDKIKSGPGFATLLEGGTVFIDKIVPYNETLFMETESVQI